MKRIAQAIIGICILWFLVVFGMSFTTYCNPLPYNYGPYPGPAGTLSTTPHYFMYNVLCQPSSLVPFGKWI